MTEGAEEALPGDRTGRPIGSGRLLDREQEQRIQEAIETKTPQELEIPSALWTRQAVQELIKQQVGIRLPIRTVGEYLRRWGFTPQKPVRKAYKQGARSPLLRKLGQGCSIASHENQGTEVLPELPAIAGAVGCPRGAVEGA